jgi:hypothetical protein
MPAQGHNELNTEGFNLDRQLEVEDTDFGSACLELGLWTKRYHHGGVHGIKHQTKLLPGDHIHLPSAGSSTDVGTVGASDDGMVRLQESFDASTRLLMSVRDLQHAMIRQAEPSAMLVELSQNGVVLTKKLSSSMEHIEHLLMRRRETLSVAMRV